MLGVITSTVDKGYSKKHRGDDKNGIVTIAKKNKEIKMESLPVAKGEIPLPPFDSLTEWDCPWCDGYNTCHKMAGTNYCDFCGEEFKIVIKTKVRRNTLYI